MKKVEQSGNTSRQNSLLGNEHCYIAYINLSHRASATFLAAGQLSSHTSSTAIYLVSAAQTDIGIRVAIVEIPFSG